MQYTDNALSIEDQVDSLLSKGLTADPGKPAFCLRAISYHRLSGYWYSLRTTNNSSAEWAFYPGTTLDAIWDRYVFDRQLRLLVFDAIERVEVAIRSSLILHLAVDQGAFGYPQPSNLPGFTMHDNKGRLVYSHDVFLDHARSLCKRELRNKNAVVAKFHAKYSNAHGEYLPFWMLLEIVEFGTLCHLLRGASKPVKSAIADEFGLKSTDVLDSWMGTLRSTRNNCAHHGRFWNQRFPVKPIIPNKKNPEWHTPVEIEDVKDTAFGTLTILKYLMCHIAPQSKWSTRIEALFAAHPNINRKLLGYPVNWEDCPIWQR